MTALPAGPDYWSHVPPPADLTADVEAICLDLNPDWPQLPEDARRAPRESARLILEAAARAGWICLSGRVATVQFTQTLVDAVCAEVLGDLWDQAPGAVHRHRMRELALEVLTAATRRGWMPPIGGAA